MSFLYAVSDIHGELGCLNDVLDFIDLQNNREDKLILLGDYFGRNDEDAILTTLKYMKDLQENEYLENQIILLMGNHELALFERIENNYVSGLDDEAFRKWMNETPPEHNGYRLADKAIMKWVNKISSEYSSYAVEVIKWLNALPYYYETDNQIFVHAGVYEDAGKDWKLASEDYYFVQKFPPTTGKFYKDIIAGHIYTSTITGDPNYNKVYWDGQSHFYIDGNTEKRKILPVLKYDNYTGMYSGFDKIKNSDARFEWQEYIIKQDE